jgi:hypothetical protein
MLHVGLDLSRKRLDYQALAEDGLAVDAGAAPPDADGLGGLAERLSPNGEPVRAAIEIEMRLAEGINLAGVGRSGGVRP